MRADDFVVAVALACFQLHIAHVSHLDVVGNVRLLVMQFSILHLFKHELLPALSVRTGLELSLAAVPVASFLLLVGACLFRPGEDIVVVLVLLLLLVLLGSRLLTAPHEPVVLHLLLLAQQVVLVFLVFDLLLLLLSSPGELRLCVDKARLLFLRLFLNDPLRLAFRFRLVCKWSVVDFFVLDLLDGLFSFAFDGGLLLDWLGFPSPPSVLAGRVFRHFLHYLYLLKRLIDCAARGVAHILQLCLPL